MDLIGNIGFGLVDRGLAAALFYLPRDASRHAMGVLRPRPVATISVLFPLHLSLPPQAAIIMLAEHLLWRLVRQLRHRRLINLRRVLGRGHSALDGYQMAHQGRTGPRCDGGVSSLITGAIAACVLAAASPRWPRSR